VNVLTIPGIREPLVTNYASDKVREYSLALYLMDIPQYDDNSARLWDDSTKRPSVRYTAETFVGRNIDNNYAASYFPDIFLEDAANFRRVKVAPSVAALSAIGFNDKVSYPWFAPAGFNRAALDFVTNTQIRLNNADRDVMQDSRVNPITSFPNSGYVIFGQKTLQLAKSALDRVNVRRLLLEVKRIVSDIANRQLVFEQNTVTTRQKFVNSVVPQLALIQAQSGIERFRVVMDETNNTTADVDANRVNGKIIIVPTRTIEFIAIDFIITNAGVEFV
jgi:phage tail sheath protein FI